MGYGFVEYDSAADARVALKTLSALSLDGHTLVIATRCPAEAPPRPSSMLAPPRGRMQYTRLHVRTHAPTLSRSRSRVAIRSANAACTRACVRGKSLLTAGDQVVVSGVCGRWGRERAEEGRSGKAEQQNHCAERPVRGEQERGPTACMRSYASCPRESWLGFLKTPLPTSVWARVPVSQSYCSVQLRELFASFGQLKSLRMPKKFDGTHRSR